MQLSDELDNIFAARDRNNIQPTIDALLPILDLAAFHAISLHAAGRFDEAVATLLHVAADNVETSDLERYKPAIRGNAEYIRSLSAR